MEVVLVRCRDVLLGVWGRLRCVWMERKSGSAVSGYDNELPTTVQMGYYDKGK